jgi:hypothetical protein
MATDQRITTPGVLRIPITGRCGHRRVIRGWVKVADDEFGRCLRLHSWNFDSDGYPCRRNTSGTGKCTIYIHHIVFEHYCGPVPDGYELDHINRDKLDCLPGNLRAVTHAFNLSNTGKRKDNTSGFSGVHWYKHCKRWGAAINARGKRLYLGVFQTPEEAARAVNAAYRIHHPHVPPPNRID